MAINFTTNSTVSLGADQSGRVLSGIYIISASGTWGSGTITLNCSNDNGVTWTAYGPETTMTANGFAAAFIARDLLYQLVLAGATSPNLNVQISPCFALGQH